MKVSVKVVAQSRKELVEVVSEENLRVRVNALPIEGKANERVIELLAEHFKTSKSKIILLRGHKSKLKVFEIKI